MDIDSQSEQVRGGKGSHRGGAAQSIRDPRVTAASQIFMNVLQGLIGIVLAFVANNLYQINLTLAADAVTKQEMARQLGEVRAKNDQQDDHINAVDRRVYTLEGRNLRGAPSRGN